VAGLQWRRGPIAREPKIEFRLLGPLEVLAEGAPISLGTPQQRALLAVLLLNANEVVSRDRLIDELWGENPPETAAKLVQVYVSRLRKALEPDRTGGGAVLVTQVPGYKLRVGPDEFDVNRFERLVEAGREALAAGKPPDAASCLRVALAMWRGPALADFVFEPFAEADVGRLEELRLVALEGRIEADLALGRTELVSELEALIARNPLRERLRGQLMLALYRSGRQSEALEAYRETRRTLVEEVGVEPGPALQRLEQGILKQDPALDAPEALSLAPTMTPAVQGLSSGGPAAQVASVPDAFIGRQDELGALLGGLDEALTGRGSVFLVAGEAGIGKSRLLDELAQNARERGARVLWGRCWEAGGAPAYWPWVQSLRAYVQERDPERLHSELGAGGAELATILPGLRERFPDLPAPPVLEPGAARFRLFEAVASFLVDAAKPRPMLLVLDDLHAADEPSLLLLQFVAGQVGAAPLLVAGAYRDAELEPDTPLASVVAELARERAACRIKLAGLGESEVGRLIESSAGVRPPEQSVAAIHRGTEGNPLFVGEVVRLLSSEGRLEAVSGDAQEALPLPPGVREVIGRRLRHLSDGCRGVLALASVLGREFEFSALVHVSDRTEEELLDALEEALAARVVLEVAGAPDRLRFAHALIRDTLYAEVAGPRRLRLHREVGEVLEALYAGDPGPHLTELAHHFVAAGDAADAAKAVEYARAAGDRAVRVLAYEEAARLYGVALEALGRDRAATHETRCELLLALGGAQARAGEGPEAKATFLHAAGLARAAALPHVLARAAAEYGGRFLWARAATDERLVPLLEDALSALGEDESVLRVQLLSRLAAARRGEPTREHRERLREEALRAARRIGDPATLAYALDATLAAVEGPRNVEDQMPQADEVIALAERIGDRERLFAGHEHAFWIAWMLGDPDRRAIALAVMIELAEELRQPAQLWLATAAQAAVALADGRFSAAQELIEQAARIGERAQSWGAGSTRKLQLFVLRRERGSLDGFETEVEGPEGTFPSLLMHRSVLAHTYASQGRTADAAAILDGLAHHDLSDWHLDEDWLFSVCLLAEVCERVGDEERSGQIYDALRPYVSLNAVGVGEVGLDSVSRSLGVLATVLGRFADASEHFDEALRTNTRMVTPPGVAHAEHDYARMLIARGDQGDADKARELTGRALMGYRSLGMESSVAQAQELERSLIGGSSS
jgi:DNA-binding SARP family transcriptional activator